MIHNDHLKKTIVFLSIAVGIVFLGVVAVRYDIHRSIGIYNDTSLSGNIIKKTTPTPTVSIPMPKAEPDRFDLLILGMRGEGQAAEGGLLTDTIQILSIQRSTGKAAMISIPRDLYIQFDGVQGKLNSAYETGLANRNGIQLASQVISKISGVYIDKTVVVDFEAFKGVVDSLGGIDIHLNAPFKESTQWGYAFELPAGDNHLNGEQALYYARSRYSSSDFDRARRQQQIIQAVKNKVLGANLLDQPSQIISLYNQFKTHVRTDLSILNTSDIIRIAQTFSKNSKPKSYVISTDNYVREDRNERKEYILVPKKGPSDYSEIQEFFRSIFAGKK